MGRGGKSQRGRVEETDDETMSTISSTGTSSMVSEEEAYEREASLLEGYVDALYEKRGTSREAGLRGLIGVFTGNMMGDFVQGRYETLVGRFVNSLKKGGAAGSEIALAARALGLLALTVAGEEEMGLGLLVEESLGTLVKLVAAGRVAAMECLAMVAFVGMNTRDVDIESSLVVEGGVMHLFWQIVTGKGAPALRAAAVSGWCLLFTTLPQYRVARYVQMGLPVLCSLLIEADDMGLRKGAGEAVGLLFQAAKLPEDVDEEEGESAGGGNECGELIRQMKGLMVSLSATEATSRQSKKERGVKVNTTSFRAFLASIEDGCECRESVVKLKGGDVLRVDTWSQTVQLNYLRKYLAEGFQKHMQENAHLHYLFNFVPREPGAKTSSKKDRKLLNSLTSKARTQWMNRRRSVKDDYLGG